MYKFVLLAWCIAVLYTNTFAQNTYTLRGEVVDAHNQPLPGAAIFLYPQKVGTVADGQGKFRLEHLPRGAYRVAISFVGYETRVDSIYLNRNAKYHAQLEVSSLSLQAVVVKDNYAETRKREESLNIEVVDDNYLMQHLGGSLMKSLERLPGVSTIDIGSGQSKPVIRGLGFNRVVVVENNIKHEGQQWGADHGLEIDQFAVENIEVIKGPASLMFGSDAIGGVVNIKHNEIPEQDTMMGKVDLVGKSNNGSIGASVSLAGRRKSVFASLRVTGLSYGDYRVPKDTVIIFPNTSAFKVGLPDGRMRNTAGYEHNYHATVGYIKGNFQSRIVSSFINTKGGLFANAQGLEAVMDESTPHDESFRDVQKPFQQVSHVKVSNNTHWRSNAWQLESNVGFQRNFRQEWTKYRPHGGMPVVFPAELPFAADLDREFKKNHYSAALKSTYEASEQLRLIAGLGADYQKNNISGRGFIIPAFQQYNAGAYAVAKYAFSDRSAFQLGVRYDFGKIQTEAYSDWYKTEVEGQETNYEAYLKKADDLSRNFSNISWSVGYNYTPANWIFKLNVGKGFRMPTPQELAANGINYHYFRHELGKADLSPEVSWQFDVGLEYSTKRFAVGASPFVNYFSNYIYLNPTAQIEQGYQVFNYTQSRVFRYGAEVHAHGQLTKGLRVGIMGEYVYSEQLSGKKQGFTLPYSPAPSAIINLRYQKAKWGFAENLYATVDYSLTAAQRNIVPPEEVTPAYSLFNLGLGADFRLKNKRVSVNLQVQNLLNTTYLKHTSFYRLMNVPEAGRNFILRVSVPFALGKSTN